MHAVALLICDLGEIHLGVQRLQGYCCNEEFVDKRLKGAVSACRDCTVWGTAHSQGRA